MSAEGGRRKDKNIHEKFTFESGAGGPGFITAGVGGSGRGIEADHQCD